MPANFQPIQNAHFENLELLTWNYPRINLQNCIFSKIGIKYTNVLGFCLD